MELYLAAEGISCCVASIHASLKRGTPVKGHQLQRMGERKLWR